MIYRNERRVIHLVRREKLSIDPPEKRVRSESYRYGLVCGTDEACLMHEISCACASAEGNMRECGLCGVWMSRANYARHIRTCGLSEKGGDDGKRREDMRKYLVEGG